VHVLCAPPNGTNPGMTSVDLAFHTVAEAAGVDRVRYWRLWDQSEWHEPPGGSHRQDDGTFLDHDSELTYELVRGRLDEFLDARCVVYWGDFLHMAVYQRHMTHVLTHRTGVYADEAEASDAVARHLLLRGQPRSTLDRVLSYGTTLSFNTARDYATAYGHDLEHFLGGARHVWHRDSYSALVAQTARRPREETCKATDAGFLLGPRDHRPRGDTLGVFIGRSELQPESVGRFGSALSRRLGLTPLWIPWGHEPGFWPMQHRRRFRLAWPGLEHHAAAPTLPQRARSLTQAALGRHAPTPPLGSRDLFDLLAGCSLVLTDTYHLAVNAWRLGTPAICLVDRPSGPWSVNSGERSMRRDKREDLYSQLDAGPLLVDASTLGLNPRRALEDVIGHLDDSQALEVIHQRVADLRQHGQDMVVGAVRRLLNSGTTPARPRGTAGRGRTTAIGAPLSAADDGFSATSAPASP
jgi:hypothetical protein